MVSPLATRCLAAYSISMDGAYCPPWGAHPELVISIIILWALEVLVYRPLVLNLLCRTH